MTPVARRRDLHYAADLLDAVDVAVLVDECSYDFESAVELLSGEKCARKAQDSVQTMAPPKDPRDSKT